jgi:hypothetical protein
MNNGIIAVALGLVMSSCSDSSHEIKAQDGEVVSSVVAGAQSEKELKEALKEIEAEEKQLLKQEKDSYTSLTFDKLKHDFGNVRAEEENTTEFKVTNTGNRPLILSDVSASCGCTMPQKPEGPIAPGESDVIKVTFKSKPGQENEIKKTVTVTANTEEKIHMLEIRAFVK